MCPSTIKEFERAFADHLQRTIHDLDGLSQFQSGSNWGETHLVACRVVFKQSTTLPALEKYLPKATAMIRDQSDIVQDRTRLSAAEIRSKCNADYVKLEESLSLFMWP